ncbi:MAG TPA: outer membrane protein assembly factor BamD [Pyrinomonadaceae bacterium]|jgi:outer membrane assembly lipoprotein YfiO|nr:outer membrane protein assembly factor BamD [Pyrinomonadaceae bacterium]
MSFGFKKAVFLSLALILASASFSFAQDKDATAAQRISVMSDKLDRMKKSLSSAISVLRKENQSDSTHKGDEKNISTPLGRLVSLQKDVNRISGDVTSLRGKVDRSDKFDRTELGALEQSVNEVQAAVDTAQIETASARATPDSPVGKPREKKKKGKFLGIFGGGGNDEYEDLIGNVSPGRDRELFIVATREVRKQNFDVGRLLFQTIITTYPDSPYLPMSKLAVGDSFFLEGSTSSLIQAIASYQDWLTFFPTHPLADRVVLKIAEAEMRQVGLPDRDATHAKRAEARLKALLQQYPNSFLKPDAELRLKEVQNNLGQHNLGVANYYYTLSVNQKKGGLKGAQSRYREIIDKYPNFCGSDEVLFKLANTYLVEEETDQAARYFQKLVSDYPNSDYSQKSREQLELIGASVPEVKTAGAQVQPCEQAGFLASVKNEFFGIYPMTIDKNGVLMTKDFDKQRFELVDQIIENQGDIGANQIPKALTTIITDNRPIQAKDKKQEPPPTQQPPVKQP